MKIEKIEVKVFFQEVQRYRGTRGTEVQEYRRVLSGKNLGEKEKEDWK